MNRSQFSLVMCCLVSFLGVGNAWSAGDSPVELQMIEHEALDGDAGAQLLYGLAYLEGRDGLKADPAKAVHWLRRSARIGNPYAQMMLGKCYADGRGIPKDPEQAVRWWREAGRNDNAEAQYLMGKAHLEGNGTSKDPTRAIYWLTKSAENGNKDAQYLVGKMYYDGYAVAQDKAIAMDWLSRAAELGHNGAIDLISVAKGLMNLTTKVFRQSADVLIDNAKQGDAQAEYELGLRYESGAWDVNQDNKQALVWITKAAEDGNHLAMKTLAGIYLHGDLGLSADPAAAAEWEIKAETYR